MNTITAPVLSTTIVLDSGAEVVLSVPGNSPTPYMLMRLPGMVSFVDCGPIENPEQYGPFSNAAEWAEWVENFRFTT